MTQDLTVFQPSPASIMDTFRGPAIPEDEEARLQTVAMLVPTTDDDPVLASLCKLVCSLLKVPAAGGCGAPWSGMSAKSCLCFYPHHTLSNPTRCAQTAHGLCVAIVSHPIEL